MPTAEISLLLGCWGAFLSTLLAAVKLWEFWRDRFRLEVDYSFNTDPSIGNFILIRNLSGRPLILSHWEVLYRSGCWFRRKPEEYVALPFPEHGARDRRIEPYSTLELRFAEDNYFSTSHKVLKGRRIYIRLFVAGRRPILKLVNSS